MKTIVVSQPMFFPWRGMFEQVLLADAFVFYDDVQFSKGSFTNRVQIKTTAGIQWLTVPMPELRLGQMINEVKLDPGDKWRAHHLDLLARAFQDAPFRDEVLSLVKGLYEPAYDSLSQLSIRSMELVIDYFGWRKKKLFYTSSELGIPGRSSQRVLDIVRALGGTRYVTGHGAKNYLDHEMFERNGVEVEYMEYDLKPYPQLHGPFDPYVSVLDLIANTGKQGIEYFTPQTRNWKKVIHG